MYMNVVNVIKFAFILFNLFLFSANAAVNYENYIIGPGDSINITVYGESDLTFQDLKIDYRETFDFPYLGNISTKNMSLSDIQRKITSGLKGQVLIDPRVIVTINQYRNFYINGVVNKPGSYQYEPGLTVEQAIAIAGGFAVQYRKTKGLYVIRSDVTRNMTAEELNEYLKNHESSNLTDKVGPGDTVYIVNNFF